ncbi:MAG TPA: tyrosine-type recombinase/integrase [Candidatus Sulfotelmatobacter sp.]|jgi:integrase/recombinase XerD|nr:tyrosine-type recombinase/integrase [Candidatus Sulfotelmatobacter sp.]
MRFSTAIRAYVEWKRARGILFKKAEPFFHSLLKQTGDCALNSITPEQVLSYLDGQKLSPATWWQRYKLFHGFFNFWILRGEITLIPMPRPRAAWPLPFKPYIYSREEITKLIRAVDHTQTGRSCNLKPLTMRTLLLFIYGTGARFSEAISCRFEDFDSKRRLITLGHGESSRKRRIPIGVNLTKLLNVFVDFRKARNVNCETLFFDRHGKRIGGPTFRGNFQRVRKFAGITRQADIGTMPGIRDLRHTFAVHRLAAWLKQGKHSRSMLPLLSAYMGHVKWIWAEQYLSLTPERFWDHLGRLKPEQPWRPGPKKPTNQRNASGELPARLRWPH